MDQERWKQIDAVFERVLDIPPGERDEVLAQMCADDMDLRRSVEALLDQENAAEGFLGSSAIDGLVEEMAAVLGSLTPGEQVGQYRIRARIGAGGMGEVWRAWDSKLDRDVAIKVLPPELAADTDRVQRFEREARTISRLKHSNIITIHDIVEDTSSGLRLIVTELVEGQTLRHRLRDSDIDWREAVLIATQIADAINAVHLVGIIHRDIKPENVMIQASGRVKLLDFGIAKWASVAAASLGTASPEVGTQTRLGVTPGTLKYMSPEQSRGESLDARTDVFSLGLILYEMITGRHPFAGNTDEEIVALLQSEEEIPPVALAQARMPAALDRIVGRALRKLRDERYASSGEMLNDLRRLESMIAARGEEKREQVLRAESADQLLTQFVVSHFADGRTRIPLSAQWTIRRFAELKHGKLERDLLRKSLLGGLTRAGLWVLLVAAVTMAAAALISVRDEFEEKVLRDGHTAAVRRAAFSPDGRLVVSVGEDRQVIVWDFARRERLKTFKDHQDWVTAVAFSPDGKWFATASFDRTVIVWDAIRLEKVVSLRGHRDKLDAVGFSPDGRLLAASGHQSQATDDATVLWRVGSWEKLEVMPYGSGAASNVLFSRDEGQLIIHGDDRHKTSDSQHPQELASGLERVLAANSAALSPDGKRLVGVNGAGEVIFADWTRRSILGRFRAHQDNARAVVWSPDGRLVASGAENVILWDAVTMHKSASLEYPSVVWGLAFSPDGRWLVSTHGDGAVLVWDVVERRREANLNEHCDAVYSVAFSHDGRRIASGGADRSAIIWDVATGRKETTLVGHSVRVSGVAFAPGGDWFASVDRDGNTVVWDLPQRRQHLKFNDPFESQDTHCLAISPDGRWLVVSHGVYESATGRQVVRFHLYDADGVKMNVANIYGVSFSVDGRWMVVADAHGYLFLWDTSSWRIADRVYMPTARLISVSFSPLGDWLVTGEDQGTVRLWATRPLRPVAELGRHAARVKSVAFSPDGGEVASAGDDKAICLWDVAGRKLTARIGTHTSPVLSVAFSPDGKQIVSGERDDSVRLYTRHRALWGWRWD